MHIVYATDGSARALAGARIVGSLPLGSESSVTILGVAPVDRGTAEELRQSQEVARDAMGASGARVARRVRWGHPAEEILNEAEASGADLIVVGDTGRSGFARRLLGSVSGRVARHARCSVLIARPLRGDSIRSVVLGVDGSAPAEEAAKVLAALPLPRDCRIRAVSVILPVVATAEAAHHMLMPNLADEVRALSQQARADIDACLNAAVGYLKARGHGCVTPEIRSGNAASEILAVVEEAEADLVVVGARGLSGVDRFFLGSVSERVLRHAPCSVLCVRVPFERQYPAAAAAQKESDAPAR
jgi:nucleotide-binding universal stress UspA family protein